MTTRLIITYIGLYSTLAISSLFSCERCYEEIKQYHQCISRIDPKHLEAHSACYLQGIHDMCEHVIEIYEMRHSVPSSPEYPKSPKGINGSIEH